MDLALALSFLLAVAKVAPMVYAAYRLSTGSKITVRGVIAYLLVGGAITTISRAVHAKVPGPAEYVQFGVACALLFVAALLSGWRPFRFRPGDKWMTAPAVVLAVEPVNYRDVVRWKIRFAYFDPEGVAQESADEVVTGAWNVGDSCLAVFRPNQPDLATLRPANG